MDLLRAFVSHCLRLYKISIPLGSSLPVSERRPGDDAAILAVMGLMQLQKYGYTNTNLLRAVVVLEFLLSYSKHNYDALLILVRLHLFLGTASLAVKAYSVLSIKSLQHATLSWIIFTRVSTTHPWLFCTKSKFKKGPPASHLLSNAIDWHKSAIKANRKAAEHMLLHGQYCRLVDHLEMQRSIELGFSKCLIAMEILRTTRLTEPPSSSNSRELFGKYFYAQQTQPLM